MRTSCSFGLVAVLAAIAGPAGAQETLDFPVSSHVDYFVDTGSLDGAGGDFETVASHVISYDDAAGIRLHFEDVVLDGESYIRVTSLLDHDAQALDAEGVAMWNNSTCYLNGSAVLLELVAAPGSVGNRALITEIETQWREIPQEHGTAGAARGNSNECGICGSDDRAPSSQDWSARLLPAGCTASVYTTRSCMISAGHCIGGNMVVQFRVPNSNANCSIVNPPAADQFPVTNTQQCNCGVGNDWAVLRTGTNGSGQRPFNRYGALRRIAPVVSPNGAAAEIYGYGVDHTCTRSQTQQRSPGNIVGVLSTYYDYNNDVRGGNSGSGFLSNNRLIGVVTHCRFGCPNIATRVDLANFVSARNSLCAACDGDVDGDGVVGFNDLLIVLNAYGFCYPNAGYSHAADSDADNCVDFDDLLRVLNDYGRTCP